MRRKFIHEKMTDMSMRCIDQDETGHGRFPLLRGTWKLRHIFRVWDFRRGLNGCCSFETYGRSVSDALSSVGACIGIAGGMLGFPVLDSAASAVICLFIMKVACDITKDAVIKMLDTSCGEAYENKLRECILSQKDVIRIDMLHSRMFGNKTYIELEISVPGEKSLWEAHEVAECIHRDVERRFSDIKHIMIHVNPANERRNLPLVTEKKNKPETAG